MTPHCVGHGVLVRTMVCCKGCQQSVLRSNDELLRYFKIVARTVSEVVIIVGSRSDRSIIEW